MNTSGVQISPSTAGHSFSMHDVAGGFLSRTNERFCSKIGVVWGSSGVCSVLLGAVDERSMCVELPAVRGSSWILYVRVILSVSRFLVRFLCLEPDSSVS